MWQEQAIELYKKLGMTEQVNECIKSNTPEKVRGDIFIRTCYYGDATVKIGHDKQSTIFVSVKTSGYWANSRN